MSDNVVETVRERTDIVDLVNESVALRKRGRDFQANCPFHAEKTPSFHVNPERQTWHCFGACATGGDVFAFVMKRDGADFREALRTLAERAGVELSPVGKTETKEAHDRLLAANEAAIVYFRQALAGNNAGAEARGYVERRGLDAKAVELFEIGFAPEGWDNLRLYLTEKGFSEQELLDAGLLTTGDHGSPYDRFRKRLMFPIRDDRGRAVGFGGRALDDARPKYLNTPQTPLFDKSRLLYGLDKAKETVRKSDDVVVVEGYLDAITAHQFGYTGVVASLGTALTEEHIRLLRRIAKRVTLCMDADAAGLDAAIRGEEVARSGLDGESPVEAVVAWDGLVRQQARAPVQLRVFTAPSGKDPDEAIREEPAGWPGWVASALPPFEFRLRLEAARTDLADPRARVELADRMLPLLLQVSYVDNLAVVARTTPQVLMARLRELTPKKDFGRRVAMQQTVKVEQKLPDRPAPAKRADDKIESFALALVLRHPTLHEAGEALDPGFFQQSDRRQLFERWRLDHDLTAEALPEELQPAYAALYDVRLPALDGPMAEQALVETVQKLRLRLLTEQKRMLTAELLEVQDGVGSLDQQGEAVHEDSRIVTIVSHLQDDGQLARALHALENELRLHRTETPDDREPAAQPLAEREIADDNRIRA
ncbi:MAG: DNA primase [Dehalococcoidia bacterium]